MTILKIITTIVLAITATACQTSVKVPPRPNSPSSQCMESAITVLKKSRLSFNNSTSEGQKCWAARQLMDMANDKRNKNTTIILNENSNNTVVVNNNRNKKATYSNECPQDMGPTAYESYKSHSFALSTVDSQACPIEFQNYFSNYKKSWENLRDIASTSPSTPLANFHAVMTKGVPANNFEKNIILQQNSISTSQRMLWKIYQKETGWCHDGYDDKDIIYWRGCPNY